MSQVDRYYEYIRCPECGKIQKATIIKSYPFFTFIHNCECGYTIMESEWETVIKEELNTKEQ